MEEIAKIVDHYRQWHTVQTAQKEIYQVSREWLPIYQNYLGPMIDLYLKGDLNGIKQAFENFFRHPMSTGLHGMHFDMVDQYMNPNSPPTADALKAYSESCGLTAFTFRCTCPDTPIDKLVRKPAGNPYGYRLDGYMIYPSAEYHYAFSEKISILLKQVKPATILELGGGFGGLAYYCVRDIPDVKFILVDLPENAALQAYYLKTMFPEKNIKLYGESAIDSQFDILIMPNFAIEEIENDSINLTFNSYSLAEMSRATMEHYIKLICRFTKDYFYHLNHVYWEVSSDEFPIDFSKFQLLFRNPTLWGKDPRSYKIDQHEYLYKSRYSEI